MPSQKNKRDFLQLHFQLGFPITTKMDLKKLHTKNNLW
jgi:hypothetical protein